MLQVQRSAIHIFAEIRSISHKASDLPETYDILSEIELIGSARSAATPAVS